MPTAHLREIGTVKSTKENIEYAMAGETHEFKSMYPQMIEDAKAEGTQGALRSFNYANDVEKIHADLYKKALDTLGKETPVEYYVCQVAA